MHLMSAPVLVGAALISSPALWNGFVGQAPMELGLARYLLAVAFSWGALTIVVTLIGPARSQAVEVASDEEDKQPATAARHTGSADTSLGHFRPVRGHETRKG